MTKFITNQNVEIQLELASLGDRILAFLIDAIILAFYGMFAGFIAAMMADNDATIVIFILIIPALLYSLLFEIFNNGQSPGKSARDIRVVKLDGSSPSIGSYLLRWLLRPIDITIYGAVAIVSIIITKNGQRLGDLAGGTTVIKVKERASLDSIKTQKKEDGYVIQFPQVKRLSDKQVELIRQSLKFGDEGLNYEAIASLTEKIKTYLQVNSDLPDVKFLYSIIADYEHLDD